MATVQVTVTWNEEFLEELIPVGAAIVVSLLDLANELHQTTVQQYIDVGQAIATFTDVELDEGPREDYAVQSFIGVTETEVKPGYPGAGTEVHVNHSPVTYSNIDPNIQYVVMPLGNLNKVFMS